MALARRKIWLARGTAFLLLATLALVIGARPLQALVSERVVADRHTGLAIFGFDPVAYFLDAKPVEGRSEFELQVSDSIWRFRNAGNRAAFLANPDVYRPRYGGYDPVAIGRGVALPGNPQIFLVTDQRLYFFYNSQARDAFARDPNTAILAAEERWPDVVRSLTQ